ncbi:MAG: hypothetical protein ACOH2A_13305 [Sphingobacteriaceae bacterium]
MNQANDVRHYGLLTIGIIVGLIGIYLRFLNESTVIAIISNILFVLGIAVCLKAVFGVLR